MKMSTEQQQGCGTIKCSYKRYIYTLYVLTWDALLHNNKKNTTYTINLLNGMKWTMKSIRKRNIKEKRQVQLQDINNVMGGCFWL